MNQTAPQTGTLQFTALEVGYGSRRIAGPLTGIWEPGRIHVISGANGSGKTTLLRTLIGLLPPLAGQVAGSARRSVSYVPQLSTFGGGFPITTEEVVATGLPMDTPSRERRERALAALQTVGLKAARRRPFFILSGGQRQRALVARALCADAALVALDEPTAGVDGDATAQVWGAIRDLASRGKLVVVVTHDLISAEAHADDLLLLDGGGLVRRDRPEIRWGTR